MTYLEVYNEKLMDLIATSGCLSRPELSIDDPGHTRVGQQGGTVRDDKPVTNRQVKIANSGNGKPLKKSSEFRNGFLKS